MLKIRINIKCTALLCRFANWKEQNLTKIYNGFKAIEEYIEYEEKLVDAVVAFGVDSEPFDALFYVEPGKIDAEFFL